MMVKVAPWRLLRLALAVNLQSKLKLLLLTVLICISTVVFLGVSELSRASTLSLDDAISSDLGATGSYRITPAAALGLSRAELLAEIRQSASLYTRAPIQVAVRYADIRPECPPFKQLGEVTAAITLDPTGMPIPFRGQGLQSSADLCLGGLVVPKQAIRKATKYEDATFDVSVVIDPVYEQLLRLATAQAPQYSIVITTGRREDQTAEIRNTMASALSDAAAKASIDANNSVVVLRTDSGDSVRSASDGIKLVYTLISWGVLMVGGIGVLVAELIVLRDRTWFFGLARAVGARKWSVAWLVVADICIVLTSGLMAALLLLGLSAPLVRSFGRSAFQVDFQVLRWSTIPGLSVGMTFMLLLGGAYPAWRATQLDPLDVLERR